MNGWMIAIVLLIHQSFIDKKEHWMILLTNTYLVMIIALATELNFVLIIEVVVVEEKGKRN